MDPISALFIFIVAPMIVSGVIAAGGMIQSAAMHDEAMRKTDEATKKADAQYAEQMKIIDAQNAQLQEQLIQNEIHTDKLESTTAGRNLVKSDAALRNMKHNRIYGAGPTSREVSKK